MATLDLPPDVPRELEAELELRQASLLEVEQGRSQHPQRTYLAFESKAGRMHAHYSTDPADGPLMDYELLVRRLVGAEGTLRAPRILAHGPRWMLAETIDPEPLKAEDSVRLIVEGAARIAELRLPESPWPETPGGLPVLLRRRWHLVRCPVPLRDVAAARRIVSSTPLSEVTSHGGYQRRHVFLADGAAYVVDWELSGRRAAGYDLLHYWSNMTPDDERRDALFEATVELVGRRWERELKRLRYALLVRMIAGKFVDDADPDGGRALLPLLPQARQEAEKR